MVSSDKGMRGAPSDGSRRMDPASSDASGGKQGH